MVPLVLQHVLPKWEVSFLGHKDEYISRKTNAEITATKSVTYTVADLGGGVEGARPPPPLSEFETLVMGLFVPVHASPPIPLP